MGAVSKAISVYLIDKKNRSVMKIHSRAILAALLLLLPMSTWAYGDRFFKGIIQADYQFSGCSGANYGVGFNIMKNDHPFALQITANYSSLSCIAGETYVTTDMNEMEISYSRLSVPVELQYKILNDQDSWFFFGGGVVYHQNIMGRLNSVLDDSYTIALTDGLNSYNLAARISFGMCLGGLSMDWDPNQGFGLKLFFDFNITPPLKEYSISDRLFEYKGPIEEAYSNTTFGIGFYYTF